MSLRSARTDTRWDITCIGSVVGETTNLQIYNASVPC